MKLKNVVKCGFSAFCFIGAWSSAAHAFPGSSAPGSYDGTVTVSVDATDLDRRIYRVHESLPVRKGTLRLFYPQWIPGTHAPTGPLSKLAGLKFTADGKRLSWRRDPLNVFAFEVDVPEGVARLDIDFQYLAPTSGNQGRVVMTRQILAIQWNTLTLYPAGYDIRRIQFKPTVTFPEHWTSASALTAASTSGPSVTYDAVDYDTLVDSPVYAGEYSSSIPLSTEADAPVVLHVFGDTPASIVPTDEALGAMKSLVRQTYLIYGAPPYERYDFLLAVSDKLSSIGREHRRSSEDTAAANFFTAWHESVERKELLPHEFNHAWNGKGRLPRGQDVDDLNTALDDELLWVYEGQTKLWGYILATRSGMWTMDESCDMLAQVAAGFDRGNPGLKTWRSPLDTTNDPIIALTGSPASTSYQDNYQYYLAGAMIWLEVDGELRRLTGNRRSLDDFSKEFFGKGEGGRADATYSLADVVRQLDELAPYDWSTFLHERLSGAASLNGGLASHGWKLVYTDQPSAIVRKTESVRGVTGLMFSLGLSVDSKGNVLEVLWDGPAFKAGVVEGQTITGVDGKPFSAAQLRDAIVAAHDKRDAPIELIVKDADGSRPVRIDYRNGLQYAHLVRTGAPDTLTTLFAPRTH